MTSVGTVRIESGEDVRPSFEGELEKQREAAAARVEERTQQRDEKVEILQQPGGLALADEPARVASRIDRLSRYRPDVRPVDPAAIKSEEPEAMAAAGRLLERVILTEDFLGVSYLEAGALAARAVGRVNIRDAQGRIAGFGTGALVSPELLLTNHHVLGDVATALTSRIEFGFEEGLDGRPLQPHIFAFDPERFFLADEELDYALVVVDATPEELAPFGFRRLIESEGKAIVGDFVSIIQHPRGEKKQVALRENRIVDVLELFLHYIADTEPGSSGSPIFNDQWEVIGLHHASVPAPDRDELGGFVNEGIRISRLIKHVRAAGESLSPEQQALIGGLFAERSAVPAHRSADAPVAAAASRVEGEAGTVRVTVPLEITFGSGNGARAVAPSSSLAAAEAITIDPDYASRRGYDEEFLGTDAHRIPLPTLPDDLVSLASVNRRATSEPRYILPYHHFSVVQNKERGLAFFTASNIDGASCIRLKREKDRWFLDPRIPESEQIGDEAYRDNPLDRGHLVRRLDPAWGQSREAAKASNDDTFHFTNCTPQHQDFNRNQTTWAGLEDYILENADNRDFKVSVFTGPVLADDDDEFGPVRLPRQFWKVVAMIKEDGKLSATAYLLSQAALIDGLESFSYGAYKTFQVPVRRIEELTRLSFGPLAEADPLAQQEAALAPKAIDRPDDIVL